MELCKADIYFIIVIIFMMYLFYKIQNPTKENIKESFAVQDDVKAAINEVYQADVDAIRNLSAVATKLQAGGLTAAGNLSVAGELYANSWVRPRGNAGLYFEDHGGGWHMSDNTWIRSYGGKNVYCDKELVGSYVRSDGDLQVNGNSKVNGKIDASHVYSGGEIRANRMFTEADLTVGGTINIFGFDFKRLTSMLTCAGFAINGDGSTFLLHEGDHQLRGGGLFGDIWADDRWDAVWIYRGWHLQCFDGNSFDGAVIVNHHNRGSNIPERIRNINDKTCSYKARWAGW
jgi:hypothetical protein